MAGATRLRLLGRGSDPAPHVQSVVPVDRSPPGVGGVPVIAHDLAVAASRHPDAPPAVTQSPRPPDGGVGPATDDDRDGLP